MKNLKESLLESGNLDCKCKVSTELVKDMEVYGFVPSYIETLMLPLGKAVVCSNRVVVSINGSYVRFPIYQTVSRCETEMLSMEIYMFLLCFLVRIVQFSYVINIILKEEILIIFVKYPKITKCVML